MTGPVEIPYEKWRSRTTGHLVTVTKVEHRRGTQAEVTSVTFTNGKTVFTWPSVAFLKAYEPVGQKLRRRTVWQLLRGKDLF